MKNVEALVIQELLYNGETDWDVSEENIPEVVKLHNYKRMSKEEYTEREFDYWFESMRHKK